MSLGGFRVLWHPLRPFIAGTKVSNYILMKNGDEEQLPKGRSTNSKMPECDNSHSPPSPPMELSSSINLVASSPRLSTCTISSNRSIPSLDVTFDGITFTANASDYFSVTPASPPDSTYENMEVSLFDDNQIEKIAGTCTPSRVITSRRSSLDSCDGFINAEQAEAAIQAVQSTPGLAKAVNSAIESGSLMPLIKEELKYTIQTKRMRNGKGELQMKAEKTPPSTLSPEEESRRGRRRERNKVAAQKCRDKRVERTQELMEEIDSLETGNVNLLSEKARLENEIQQLRNMLIRHEKASQCDLPILPEHEDSEIIKPQRKRQKTSRRPVKVHTK